jgi:hypothetical protein
VKELEIHYIVDPIVQIFHVNCVGPQRRYSIQTGYIGLEVEETSRILFGIQRFSKLSQA